jgi:hypothetical protein
MHGSFGCRLRMTKGEGVAEGKSNAMRKSNSLSGGQRLNVRIVYENALAAKAAYTRAANLAAHRVVAEWRLLF